MRSSLLFDLFAANQRVRSLLVTAMDGAGLKPDEYAVYSALFEFEPMSPTEIAGFVGACILIWGARAMRRTA